MTIDSTTLPKTKRIAGTLHKRGYVAHAPVQDEDLPREGAEEREEVAGRHGNSGQMDHKGHADRWRTARTLIRNNTSTEESDR